MFLPTSSRQGNAQISSVGSNRESRGSGVQPVPERFADRQLALCDIIEPELIHHCITIVISEGPTGRQEGRGQQAITNQLCLLSIQCLQHKSHSHAAVPVVHAVVHEQPLPAGNVNPLVLQLCKMSVNESESCQEPVYAVPESLSKLPQDHEHRTGVMHHLSEGVYDAGQGKGCARLLQYPLSALKVQQATGGGNKGKKSLCHWAP